MGFNLLANPFAILGLPADATAGEVTARARQLTNAEAAAASRSLLIPKTRLQAELSYLPGASQKLSGASIEALKAGREPALPLLSPLARCNVLAHLASHGRASAAHLRDLAGLQDAIRPTAVDLVGAARQQAGMPPVSEEMLDAALEALVGQHADAFAEGMLAASDGANLFAAIILAPSPEATARASFLRQSAAAWERATPSDAARDLESATPLEQALRDRPDPDVAGQLATIMSRFATRTKPPRMASRLVGMPHAASVDAAQRWRAVALDLNNRQNAVAEAVCIFEALADGFGTDDELGILTARDLKVCRERLASGEGTPEMRRLLAAVEAAGAGVRAFQFCEIVDRRPTGETPAAVLELYQAFVAATVIAVSDLPWRVLRSFTLRLQNEFSATAAALTLTEVALAQCTGKALATDIVASLVADRRVLRRELLSNEFEAALRAGKKRVARRALSELRSLAETAEERRKFHKASLRLNRQRRKSRLKYSLAGFCLCVFVKFIASSSGPLAPLSNAYPGSGGSYNQAAISSHVAASIPATVDSDAGQPDRRPAPGSDVLTRPELRWCRYQFARIEAARNYLAAAQSNPAYTVDQFNAGVKAFDAFVVSARDVCAGRHYQDADGPIIDGELRLHSGFFAIQGQKIVAAAMQTGNRLAVQATPAAAQPSTPAVVSQATSPAATNSPPSAVSDLLIYGQGQADRRDWESWIAGQSGDFRSGADWWAGVRSSARPPSCNHAPGLDHATALAGCNAARARLAYVDRRRHTAADYWYGWNNP